MGVNGLVTLRNVFGRRSNMKNSVVLCLFLFLAACAGPVQVAKNESEGLKTAYEDPELAALSRKYNALLNSIYARYRLSQMSLAKEGLGFTFFSDNSGRKLPYLLVEIRPEN